jgi:hypothetical protein
MNQIDKIYLSRADESNLINRPFVSKMRQYFVSTYEMAKVLNVSWPTARRWEKYPGMMTIGDIFTLAHHCKMSVKDMAQFIYDCQYKSVQPTQESDL